MNASSSSSDSAGGVVVKRSRFGYDETIRRLSAAIVTARAQIFATIDQRAAARDAGLDMRPTTLLVWGNPAAGTPLMVAAPLFALELPLKFLVWDDGAQVCVAYEPLTVAARRYAVSGFDTQLAAIDRALEHLASSVSGLHDA